MDRSGRVLGTLGEPANYGYLDLSPDGTRAAVSIPDSAQGGTRDIWIYDLARGVRTRSTVDPANDIGPVWSSDGNQLAYTSNRTGTQDIYLKSAGGTVTEQALVQGDDSQLASSWSRDGRYMLFESGATADRAASDGRDIWLLPFAEGKPVPFIQTPFVERSARFSPDGKWVVYESNETHGRNVWEVWVTAFPRADRRWLLSTGGGIYPRWRGDGREIFYLSHDRSRLIAAAVDGTGATFQIGDVRPLFEPPVSGGTLGHAYDVSSDGQRFLFIAPVEARATEPITVVLNWMAGLGK
jgi:Tol biopolymer transport system component